MQITHSITSSDIKDISRYANNFMLITPLGYGGAFSTVEGNSSFLVRDLKSKKNLLVDCGSLVYRELRERGLTDLIDWVYITHTHEDHIGSLSTLIYENWFIHKKKLKLLCHPAISHQLTTYLITVCNHEYEQFQLDHYWEEDFSKDFPSLQLDHFNTTDLHFPKLPTSGFILTLLETDFKVVFSGDLGVDVTEFLELDKKLLEKKEMVIFQDAGTYQFTEETHKVIPHAYYLDCDNPSTFIYHHFENEVPKMKENLKHAESIADMVKEKKSLLFHYKIYFQHDE